MARPSAAGWAWSRAGSPACCWPELRQRRRLLLPSQRQWRTVKGAGSSLAGSGARPVTRWKCAAGRPRAACSQLGLPPRQSPPAGRPAAPAALAQQRPKLGPLLPLQPGRAAASARLHGVQAPPTSAATHTPRQGPPAGWPVPSQPRRAAASCARSHSKERGSIRPVKAGGPSHEATLQPASNHFRYTQLEGRRAVGAEHKAHRARSSSSVHAASASAAQASTASAAATAPRAPSSGAACAAGSRALCRLPRRSSQAWGGQDTRRSS